MRAVVVLVAALVVGCSACPQETPEQTVNRIREECRLTAPAGVYDVDHCVSERVWNRQ